MEIDSNIDSIVYNCPEIKLKSSRKMFATR